MTTLTDSSSAGMHLIATWESDDTVHEEHYHAADVNMWRDIFPPVLRQKLLGCRPGDEVFHSCSARIMLQNGTAGHSAIDVARRLLSEFRSLRGLLTAERHALCRVRGLGDAKYALLQASVELSRRHYAELMQMGPALANPRATREFLRARLRDRDHEVFCCLFLDNRHRVICFDEVFRGTIDGASVHPRDVVKLALARNAAAVILAHNHPSGVAEPSQADVLITGRLREALALVDIRVLDHIVVGDGACVSFAERGLL